jgi:radical SAM superfamily enzyme YgiQ (UPF0313 family)
MKILFLEIDQEREWAVASIGPAFLGAWLRQHGHQAEIYRVGVLTPIDEVISAVTDINPGLIGVSLTSRQWLRAREVVGQVRASLDIPVIAGGLHPTFGAEMVLAAPGFDYVCLGEGELPLLELVQALEQGKPTTGLRNLICASSNLIQPARPELHPPIEPIDSIPFMARDMLDERYGVVHMATQRGCPYPCTYCAARQYSDLYGSYSNYGRRRTLDNVMAELEQIRAEGELNYVIFLDDTFTINHRWVKEFCNVYAQRFRIPFSLHVRVETVNPDLLAELARAGCAHITYGVESGSERVRKEIMDRHAPNSLFKEVFAATREAGILVTANYIIGTPGETPAEVEETLALHDELMPDDFGYFVFYPYPGTALFKTCLDKGYLPDDYYELPANHRRSILTFPSMSQADIEGFYERFTEVRKRDHGARLRQHGTLHGQDMSEHESALFDQIETSARQG